MFKGVIAFGDERGTTRVTLTLTFTDRAQRDPMVAFGAAEGGWQTLSRLAAWLSRGA